MKKEMDVKYPHSASLFQFCRRVLDHKFGGIRVIDQDVGQILEFDPADCSHWKKGKKNIKSIQAIKSIANHLGVDEKLVVDVACGEMDDAEAFFEYSGYGSFNVDEKTFENAKKKFYRQQSTLWTRDKEQEFRDAFSLNEASIDKVVQTIHQKINFEEAPLYLPEIVVAYPHISLVASASAKDNTDSDRDLKIEVHTSDDAKSVEIRYNNGLEMRPFTRFQLCKAMGKVFLEPATQYEVPTELQEHIDDIRTNLFAAKLLTPASLVKKELQKVDIAKDIVSQLAEVFWVSKTFMNRRLREILVSSPEV